MERRLTALRDGSARSLMRVKRAWFSVGWDHIILWFHCFSFGLFVRPDILLCCRTACIGNAANNVIVYITVPGAVCVLLSYVHDSVHCSSPVSAVSRRQHCFGSAGVRKWSDENLTGILQHFNRGD